MAGTSTNGAPVQPFFTGTTAATLHLALTSGDQIAAATPGQGALDGSNAEKLATLDLGDTDYRQLITGFGVIVSSATTRANNQALLTSQVDASRESLSGVNVDEEMVNLLAAQRGYEGASRVLTTLDSVLDTLINRTGVTR
jgi:flagellar hook-associated protein 1 FlgK